MSRLVFPAMGTTFELHVAADGAPAQAALGRARAEVDRLEGVFSRFRDTSELSRLNRAGAGRAGTDMRRVLGVALTVRDLTDGWFDPCVGSAVRAAGYDRPFDDMPAVATMVAAPPAHGYLVMDPTTGDVLLGAGAQLDLGAVAKGYAADMACAVLSEAGPALVSAGGDVVASGPRPEGPWPVGIATGDGELVATLTRGAIATSGVDRRRWRTRSGDAHHVIDPRTGHPSDTDLWRVSVSAATGAEADAVATALLAAGRTRARQMVARLDVGAVFVTTDGEAEKWGDLQ